MITNLIFYISLFLLLHSYVLYPFSIWILSIFKKKYSTSESTLPAISILISAYNEEKVIEKTIRNFLECEYDKKKIEIIIGSDKSEDRTCEIVEKLKKEIPQIKFFPFDIRRGKSQVLNDLVEKSTNDILIFSDANTIYKKDALKNLVKYYHSEKVGGVSGKLILLDHREASKAASKEKTYWDIETLLKEKEGDLGILIGANGGIYSIRKKYFEKIPLGYPVMDDFYISVKVLEKKKLFLYVEDAKAEEFISPDWQTEFKRKIRNNSIMLSTIRAIKGLLNPLNGLVSYGLWSHKIIRWFSPVLLIFLFLSNIFLVNQNSLFLIFFLLQIIFYLLAILGYLLDKFNKYISIPFICFYFSMTNIAMLIGIYRFLTKKHTNFWQSTARVNE